MKRIFLLLGMLAMVVGAGAVTLSNETLRYKVGYKWGVVEKNGGTATIKLTVNGNNAKATLYGRTDPWADKIYHLRDTLISSFDASTCQPTLYTRIAHEDGSYARDEVRFSRSGNTSTGNCTRWRRGKKDKETTKSTTTLTAQGITVDMMSAFYYMRTIDYAAMSKGESKKINIFSGKKKEYLTITYVGEETVKISGKQYKAYRVRFTFTTDGRKQSSEPISAWISTDSRRIPLKIEGSLKIGKIRCIYAGG